MIQVFRYVAALVGLTAWYGTSVILAALARVAHRPGGVYDRAAREWGRGLLRATGVTVEVRGEERLRPDRPCVYVANHASFADIWVLLASLPGTIRFVFKKEFLRFPLLGLAMVRAGHIRIDRQRRAAAFAAYDDAAQAVRRGTSPVVFAEGTRSRDGRLLPFKKGPFVLAIAAQVPVVPVLVEGGFALMPRGALAPRRGTMRVAIGEEIPTVGLDYDDREALAERTRAALVSLGGRP